MHDMMRGSSGSLQTCFERLQKHRGTPSARYVKGLFRPALSKSEPRVTVGARAPDVVIKRGNDDQTLPCADWLMGRPRKASNRRYGMKSGCNDKTGEKHG